STGFNFDGLHGTTSTPLTWTPGILGLDLAITAQSLYPTDVASDAAWTSVSGNFQCDGGGNQPNPGCFLFENPNDTSGSATPGVVLANGTFASLLGIVLGTTDATNQLYLDGPPHAVAGYPSEALSIWLGAPVAGSVAVNLGSNN